MKFTNFIAAWLVAIGSIAACCALALADDADSKSAEKPKSIAAKTPDTAAKSSSAEISTTEKTAVGATNTADFEQVFAQWQSVLSELAKLQILHRTASPEQRAAMSAEIADFVHKATALSAQLETSAEQAYAADANNRRAGDLLLTMAVAALRKDDFDRAAQVAKFLIDHHYPGGEPLRIAASSAFATMQFDDAKKYLAELAIVNPGDPTSAAMQSAIDRYEPKWQREQKLRAAETKADDLPRVKLKTTQGDILVELFENDAPNTVANFISLVEKHFYDGSQFHRVLPGFMAQGGDPLSKDPKNDPATIGSGGPGYTIPDECNLPNHREHFRGSLSMAHTGEPNSGGSQFFICFVPTEQLDGKYTVFGRVIEGLDVLAKLQRIDPSKEKEHSLGLLPDRIEKAEVLRKRDHAYEPTTIGKKPVAAP